MRRYYVQNQGKFAEVYSSKEAEWIMLEKEELLELEKKLKNKTEEAARWVKRLTGEDLDYRIIMVDYIHEKERRVSHDGVVREESKVYVTITLPIPYEMNAKNAAKALVERVFHQYTNKGRSYKLHFAPKVGWSVNLELTEQEYDTFQLPN